MSRQAIIRFGELKDLGWCMKHDNEARHVSREVMKHKIKSHEIIVTEIESKIVGYLRLEYLWLRIPYIGLVFVLKEYQRRGIGRRILRFLEVFLRKRGHKVLLSSSQVDEPIPSQVWHRKMGFEECGVLSGINEEGVGEVFFRKSLA